jgi:hypothetical protein
MSERIISPDTIFTKTPAGQAEVQHRTLGLPIRLRALLVMVDGTSNAASLIQRAGTPGAGEQLLAELWIKGLIADASGRIPVAPEAAGDAANLPPAPVAASAAAEPQAPSAQHLAEAKSLLRYCIRNGAGMWESRSLNKALDSAHTREELLACMHLIAERLSSGSNAGLVDRMRQDVLNLLGGH